MGLWPQNSHRTACENKADITHLILALVPSATRSLVASALRREQMKPARHSFSSVKIDPKENRLSKEGEPFQRERHSNDGAGKPHELWPKESKFKRQHSAGHRSYRKEDGCALRPTFCQQKIGRISRGTPAPLRMSRRETSMTAKMMWNARDTPI